MLGRAFASYGTNVPQAIAAAVILFREVAGGAGDPMAQLMAEELGDAVAAQRTIDDAQIEAAAKAIVADAMRTSGRMPGFGIRAHAIDPRAPALLKVAEESGAAGNYCHLLVAIERELARVKGRAIPINLDGIVAALVLDFGFPMGCAAAFVMIPRSFSTLAHHLEEKEQKTRWRHVPTEHVIYTGPMPGDE